MIYQKFIIRWGICSIANHKDNSASDMHFYLGSCFQERKGRRRSSGNNSRDQYMAGRTTIIYGKRKPSLFMGVWPPASWSTRPLTPSSEVAFSFCGSLWKAIIPVQYISANNREGAKWKAAWADVESEITVPNWYSGHTNSLSLRQSFRNYKDKARSSSWKS